MGNSVFRGENTFLFYVKYNTGFEHEQLLS